MADMLLLMLESAQNLLLGMTMDPRIPQDTRDVMLSKANEIGAVLAQALDEEKTE